MKALAYHGAHDMRVDEVPDPRIEADDDIILRVTATAICGSDLHIYRGKIPDVKHGDILGHEFMGIVEEAGARRRTLRPERSKAEATAADTRISVFAHSCEIRSTAAMPASIAATNTPALA